MRYMKNVAQCLTDRRHFINVGSPLTSSGAGSAGGKEPETDIAIIQHGKSPTELRTEESEESLLCLEQSGRLRG